MTTTNTPAASAETAEETQDQDTAGMLAAAQALPALAYREMQLRQLKDRAARVYEAAQAETAAALAAARQLIGTKQIAIRRPDGTEIGTASAVAPVVRAHVTDGAALSAWVQAHHAGEVTVRTVLEIRPAWLKGALAQMTERGAPELADADGTVHTVPGVEVGQVRAGGHQVKIAADADPAGLLDGVELAELLAGGEDR